jgi:putative SOS response-associated peptidase YedK
MLTASTRQLLSQFKAKLVEPEADPVEWQPRYNIAPSQMAPVIVSDEDGFRYLRVFQWGLIPYWSKDDSFAHKTINCRGETASEKPSFREAFRHRRCLVPLSGFFEWKRVDPDNPKNREKLPYRVHSTKKEHFSMAGLWESWKGRDTFTIVTTEANPFMKNLHERMPRILTPQEEKLWMDPSTPLEELKALARMPYSGLDLAMHRVSTKLNSPANEGERLIKPIPETLKLLTIALLLLGCTTSPTRPCSNGGDTSWRSSTAKDGTLRGDKHCLQRKGTDGVYLNHGHYSVTFPGSNKKALEGRFENGKKEGFWYEYNESGTRIAERYYENGVEKSPPQKK